MPWHWHIDVERRFSFAILQKNFIYYHRDRYVRKSTVHQSGLTPLRAQISNDGLVYCRIYPLACIRCRYWPSALISPDPAKKIGSVPVGTPAVPDTWVSVGQWQLILVANYPLRLASTLMLLKEICGSVSLKIPTLPIEQVDLNLHFFRGIKGRYVGRVRRRPANLLISNVMMAERRTPENTYCM